MGKGPLRNLDWQGVKWMIQGLARSGQSPNTALPHHPYPHPLPHKFENDIFIKYLMLNINVVVLTRTFNNIEYILYFWNCCQIWLLLVLAIYECPSALNPYWFLITIPSQHTFMGYIKYLENKIHLIFSSTFTLNGYG